MSDERRGSEEDWWTEIDNDIMGCLAGGIAFAPAESGFRLGTSEGATTSLLSMLVGEGKAAGSGDARATKMLHGLRARLN